MNKKPLLPKTDKFGNKLVFSLRVYVSRDGKYVHSEKQRLTIYGEADEEPYILINKRKYEVATLVATCYRPMPKDGKAYILIHKDGNLQNCDMSNLEWQPYVYKFNTNPTTKVWVNSKYLVVTSKGEVLLYNQELTKCDELFDGDTNLSVCINPFVIVDSKRVFMDDLMTKAQYIQGDRDSLNDPVILHRDHDRNNYDSSNLEWVERTDPRYIAYQKNEIAFINKRNEELNPGIEFPDFMKRKIDLI